MKLDVISIGAIAIYREILIDPNNLIRRINYCESISETYKWERARVYNGITMGAIVDSRTNFYLNLIRPADLSEESKQNFGHCGLAEVNNYINIYFQIAIKDYCCRFGAQITNNENPIYQVLRYSSDEYFRPHSDDSPATPRRVSGLCYLNNNFDGGELEFTFAGVLYKPHPGDIVLFPSNFPYAHAARPVSNGTKYSIVNWWN